ncbi:MAG: hypothetical protein K2G31_02400 [Clostridia bacterium]|nr:hypothetical protein [Clostridia bacterium]
MIVKNSSKNFNCFKSTWRYFASNGVYLVLINLVPTLLLAFLLSPSSTLYYLFHMKSVDASDLGNLFNAIWHMPFGLWYLGLIGLILLVLTGAVTFGVIDRHMRVGEFTVSPHYIKKRLNYNLFTAIKFVVVALISLEFYNIVTTVLYFLWANVFSNPTTALVFSIITLCLMELGMICTMSLFILWPPYMLHTGLKSAAAFKMAWSNMSGKTFKTMLTIISIVLPLQIIMVITAAFDLGVVCRLVLDALSFALVVPFYFTLMYNTFYEVTGTERMDLVAKKKDIWSKNKR